mmetsp:Transcript_16134/g.41114  ORF Transcript_16134/g.41114 Transcript_16134/m.41114 type:complete len:441 (-) Transcript_16134:799-2121(-)
MNFGQSLLASVTPQLIPGGCERARHSDQEEEVDRQITQQDVVLVRHKRHGRSHLAREEEETVEEQKVEAHRKHEVEVVADLVLVRPRVVLCDHGDEKDHHRQAGLDQRVLVEEHCAVDHDQLPEHQHELPVPVVIVEANVEEAESVHEGGVVEGPDLPPARDDDEHGEREADHVEGQRADTQPCDALLVRGAALHLRVVVEHEQGRLQALARSHLATLQHGADVVCEEDVAHVDEHQLRRDEPIQPLRQQPAAQLAPAGCRLLFARVPALADRVMRRHPPQPSGGGGGGGGGGCLGDRLLARAEASHPLEQQPHKVADAEEEQERAEGGEHEEGQAKRNQHPLEESDGWEEALKREQLDVEVEDRERREEVERELRPTQAEEREVVEQLQEVERDEEGCGSLQLVGSAECVENEGEADETQTRQQQQQQPRRLIAHIVAE